MLPTKTLTSLSFFFLLGYGSPANAEAKNKDLHFRGTVVDDIGDPILGAKVQFWQTDVNGVYDHSGDGEEIDPSFQYFGTDTSDEGGSFFFKTHRPGIYPGRPSHIHFKVFIGGKSKLTSQFYFDDENTGKHDSQVLTLRDVTDANVETISETRKTIVIDMKKGGSFTRTLSDAEGPFYPEVDFFEYDNDLTRVLNAKNLVIDWKVQEYVYVERVTQGENIIFEWSFFHDVWEFNNEESYEKCDFDNAEKKAATTNKPIPTKEKGMRYFGCGVASHCDAGQKVRVSVKKKKFSTEKTTECEGAAAIKTLDSKKMKKCKKTCKKNMKCFGFQYTKRSKKCILFDERPTQVNADINNIWCGIVKTVQEMRFV